ncbi:competence type IV pilus minor pilin ComGD [Alkalibacillus silvisoli]|uniref:Prepilin-type N-terminal cleavage/methylation domain-containing protein n=1 Tax=Alkalibacillus silvisoli TaxID=392823 RepID=A0ABN0ZSX5_9BACI
MIKNNFNNQGFTLIEILLVLSIVLLITHFSWNAIKLIDQNRAENQFFETFEQDVFYIQQYTLLHQRRLTLLFNSSNSGYIIYENPFNPPLVERKFDENIRLNTSAINNRIVFNTTGSITRPGSFRLIIDENEFLITFPFGKGRYYVTKT